MKKVNTDRIRRLREKQFGEGERKREWVMGMLCGVTGQPGTEQWPIDPAHAGSPDPYERGQSTRAAGADDTYLFPMRREVHSDYDSLDEAKWEEKYGVSKQWVREYAAKLDREWREMQDR